MACESVPHESAGLLAEGPALVPAAGTSTRLRLSQSGRLGIDLVTDRVRQCLQDSAVLQRRRAIVEAWPIALEQPLPVVPVPLLPDDPDVPLDMQRALHPICDIIGYDDLIDYRQPPVGPLTPTQLTWVEEQLRRAGRRRAVVAGQGHEAGYIRAPAFLCAGWYNLLVSYHRLEARHALARSLPSTAGRRIPLGFAPFGLGDPAR